TTVRFSYNSLVYSDEFIRKSASDVESIVMQVIDNPEIDLKDIKIGK
ncbi:MAG: hypothetical protein GY950_16585, partial [bacterium]|nr:hypothetical protein [bacterium]